MIMTIGLLPDAMKPDPLRLKALDPEFHGVPTGPAHANRGADGVGVS